MIKNLTHRSGLALLVLLLVVPLALKAQTQTGTVTGRVVDSSGSPVPNTAVTLTNLATGLTVKAATQASGLYTFSLLPPGNYRVDAQKSGFQQTAVNFSLAVDQTARMDLTLKVGQLSQEVVVKEKPVLLDAETSSLGSVISNREVVDLPLNGRNPFALAALVPGVEPLGSFGVGLSTTRGAAIAAGANNFMASGGTSGANDILLDGVPVSVCCQGQPALIPSTDAIQQFKVQTNVPPAEFGRTSGGILNLVTKSGGNEVHGSAYDFIRNDKLDAAPYFSNALGKPPIPGRNDGRLPLRYNQYGFTVGGPLTIPHVYSGTNKTFFFAGMEGVSSSKTNFHTTTVPTALMRQGDFSEAPAPVYDPSTTAADPNKPGHYLRQPFANNQIPSSELNPIALKYLALFPMPNLPGTTNNLFYTNATKDLDRQENIRIDHNVTDSYRIFGLVDWDHNEDDAPDAFNRLNAPNSIDQIVDGEVASIDQVIAFSPTTLFTVQYGFSRQRNQRIPGSVGADPTTYGFDATFAGQQQFAAIPAQSISGFSGLSDTTYRNWVKYTHAIESSLVLVRGAHTVRMGWDGRLIYNNEYTGDGGAAGFSYSSTFTSGPDPRSGLPAGQGPFDSFASFLLGLPAGGSMQSNTAYAYSQWYHGLYVQDDWHVTHRLTLNLGLRYDLESGFNERYNRVATFDPNIANPLARATGLPLTGGVVFAGVNGQPRRNWKTEGDFSPRIGAAYSLTSTVVLRAAYGIFRLPTTQRLYGSTNPGFTITTPFLATIDGVTPVGSISTPFPNGILSPIGASEGAMTGVGSSIGGVEYNTSVPYVQQWNAGIQKQLGANSVVSITYAGSHGVKLPINLSPNDLNPKYFGAPGDTNQVTSLLALVPNPFYGVIPTGPLAAAKVQQQVLLRAFPQFTYVGEQYLSAGSSSYNALEINFQHQSSNGLTLNGAYTWSKSMGNVNNLTTSFLDTGSPGYQNSYLLGIERSVNATDAPQRLVLSAVYALPFGKGTRNVWLHGLIGGWQANGIMTLQSGLPLHFGVTGTQPFAGSRPVWVDGQNPLTSGDIHDRLGRNGTQGYLNPAAFRLPQSFELGNVSRLVSQLRAPGQENIDFSVMKDFTLTERLKLQLRGEAFNLFNQVRFSGPNTTVGSANFGQITSQANLPREVQVALKLLW